MSYWSKVLDSQISRRRALATVGAGVAGAAFLAACGGDDKKSSGGSSKDEGAIKRGGELRLGMSADLRNIEVHNPDTVRGRTMWLAFDTLTHYDHDRKPQPQLAKSWEQSDGGATTTIKLREGVKFHTGREFTSADVAWNFNRIKDPNLAFTGAYKRIGGWFSTVETPDKYTVVLKAATPLNTFFDALEVVRMADRENIEGPNAATTLVGTGPFKFVEWKQGQYIKLVKNATYWNSDVPYVDAITWQVGLEPQTLLAQFEAGALDGVDSPTITGFARYQKDSNYQTILHPATGSYYINGINSAVAPFNDKRVRQAFNWAMDRKRYVDLTLKGLGEPTSLPWPKNSLAYDKSQADRYSFDPKKAKDLLSAAGVTSLKTDILVNNTLAEVVDFAPLWKEDLRSLGIDLQINVLDLAGWGQAINSLSYKAIYAGNSGGAGNTPASMYNLNPAVWAGDGKSNTAFDNPRWQELTLKAPTVMDQTEQRKIYLELNDILLDSSNLQIPSQLSYRLALHKNVKGITYNLQDSWEFSQASLA